MKFTGWPVVEVEVAGQVVRVEQDNGSMHVGSSVWPCSLLLLKWAERQQAALGLRGKYGIELGAGCGAAGLGLALLGLNLLLTDIAPVLPALKRNLKSNLPLFRASTASTSPDAPGKLKIAQLYWGNQAQIAAVSKRTLDFIIATDVVYMENLVEPLLSTMAALASPSTRILLGYQLRSPEAHQLFWSLCPQRFYIDKVPREELHPSYAFQDADIFILRKKEAGTTTT